MSEDQYYLQDKRTIVGNSMSWWAIDGRGYTCDIRCAQVWTKEELEREQYFIGHAKYFPWKKDFIDNLVQHHIDIQDVRYSGHQPVFNKNPHTLVQWRPDLLK